MFLWQQLIEPSTTTNIGGWKLSPGGAVKGWVIQPGGRSEVVVQARRTGTGASPNPDESNKGRLLNWSSSPDDRGQFLIDGLPPGRYELLAKSDGLESGSVQVALSTAGEVRELDQPLTLRPEGVLELVVEPALDFWGAPWKIDLLESTDDVSQLETAASGVASYSGSWESPSLPAGNYVLRVRDSTGGSWLHRPLQLSGESESAFIDLEVVEVRGRLSRGDEPLKGKILFGAASPKIEMIADGSGRFEGSLPEETIWEVQVALPSGTVSVDPLEVEVPDGKSYADIEIALPNTRVFGTVTHNGDPIDAMVLALRGELDVRERSENEKLRVDLHVITNDDGEYDLLGAPPGEFQIRASRGELVSGWSDVTLTDDSEIELHFELEEKKMSRGVLLFNGAPLGGAKVYFVEPGRLPGATVSSTDGTFELAVRQDTRQVELFVYPPLGGLTFRRLELGPDPSEPQVIEISNATGELVYLDPKTPATVEFRGVRFPFISLIRALGPDLRPHPAGGLAIPNVEAGSWRLCADFSEQQSCQTKQVMPGSSTLFSVNIERDSK